MSEHIVILVGKEAPRLRRHNAQQLARELERLTVIDGGPLPGATSAAALIRNALERDSDVVELEDPELLALYVVIDALQAPLPSELGALCDAIRGALKIAES